MLIWNFLESEKTTKGKKSTRKGNTRTKKSNKKSSKDSSDDSDENENKRPPVKAGSKRQTRQKPGRVAARNQIFSSGDEDDVFS